MLGPSEITLMKPFEQSQGSKLPDTVSPIVEVPQPKGFRTLKYEETNYNSTTSAISMFQIVLGWDKIYGQNAYNNVLG